MQRKKSFVVVLAAIVFASGALAQGSSQRIPALDRPPAFSPATPPTGPEGRRIDLNKLVAETRSLPLFKAGLSTSSTPRFYALLLDADYYTQHFGIMCKKEWQFEKTTHIPLRFRLGSLEECNMLEGKK